MAKLLLHLEGAIVLFASLYFYHSQHFSWIVFILLLFVFDVSMIGYVFNEKVGSYVYNTIHSYMLPVILILVTMHSSNHILWMIGLIWMAHIGMDRMLGFGLKYPSSFQDSHFQKL